MDSIAMPTRMTEKPIRAEVEIVKVAAHIEEAEMKRYIPLFVPIALLIAFIIGFAKRSATLVIPAVL